MVSTVMDDRMQETQRWKTSLTRVLNFCYSIFIILKYAKMDWINLKTR